MEQTDVFNRYVKPAPNADVIPVPKRRGPHMYGAPTVTGTLGDHGTAGEFERQPLPRVIDFARQGQFLTPLGEWEQKTEGVIRINMPQVNPQLGGQRPGYVAPRITGNHAMDIAGVAARYVHSMPPPAVDPVRVIPPLTSGMTEQAYFRRLTVPRVAADPRETAARPDLAALMQPKQYAEGWGDTPGKVLPMQQ